MRDVYGDQFDVGHRAAVTRLVPERLQRLAGAAIFLGLIAAMGLWSYRLGTRDASEVPVIQAMAGPSRAVPDDPGGREAAHQGLEVNAVLAGDPAPEPAPAQPIAPEPPALASEDAPQPDLVPLAPAPADPLPELATVPETPSETDMLVAELAGTSAVDAGGTGSVTLAPFAVAPDEGVTAPEDAAVEPVAGARPRGRPAGLAPPRRAAPPADPAPVRTAEVVPAAAADAGAGTRLVQLGAFDSAEMARQAWSQLQRRHGDLLAPKSLYLERTTANARVFYRLRVAGFSSSEQTRVMCEALRARAVDCIPVTLR